MNLSYRITGRGFRRRSRTRQKREVRQLAVEPLENRMVLSAFLIKHTPYLQLGDAPLVGFAGSEQDRVQLLWQTVPPDPALGAAVQDSFAVQYRRVGDTQWTSAGPTSTIDTGDEGRINHFVNFVGLSYDADYEYRVQHLRDGNIFAGYQNTFHTRLPAGTDSPFTFVAYGDSASIMQKQMQFRRVQKRINLIDPAFAVVLGDNAYPHSTHPDYDARFDPTINPESTAWNAKHIDYTAFGNHELHEDPNGKPTEDNYAVPVPVAGVTAPAAPPSNERAEHNYSFDYGSVHFVTFDTNSAGDDGKSTDAVRLDAQLKYVEADLAASRARWKIVFGHHPVSGAPDKDFFPDDNYYQQVVPRLRVAGADLFLVGHSHMFSWTYPLLGQDNGVATFVRDTDKEYAKGAGLVQVVAGTGGDSGRPGTFDQFPFVAAGFTESTIPKVEPGVAQIDVTPTRLQVRYVMADNGRTRGLFSIVATSEAPSDTTAPRLSGLPGNQTLEATGPAGAIATYSRPTASDAVDTDPAVSCSPASGSTFPLGVTTVSCTARDDAGNSSSATFTSTVRDATAPRLSDLPGNQTLEAVGPAGAVATYSQPTASDAVDADPAVSCSPASGWTFPLGATTVSCTARDNAGNSSSATFTITVRDATAPRLSDLPGNQTLEAIGPAGAVATYSQPTASDAVDADPAVSCSPASGSTFPLGLTTVSCTATDDAGNSSSAAFTITVRDATAPLLSDLPGNQTLEAAGPAGAVATYLQPTGSDAVDSDPVVSCSPASGWTFPLGVTTVSCTARDEAGNSSSATFTISVRDTTAPTIAGWRLVTARSKFTGIELRFSEELDPLNATSPNNYGLFTAGRDRLFGTRDDQPLSLGPPRYSAASHTVMLSLTKPLSVTPALRITVNAAQNITGLGGNPLDGDGDNIPGGQYVALIGRSFSYKDQTGGIVSLAVARVGMLELRNGPEGNWHHHLRIVNAVAKRSVLFERGRRLGPGVDGITTLQSITGSTAVRNRLTTPSVVEGMISAAVVDELLALFHKKVGPAE